MSMPQTSNSMAEMASITTTQSVGVKHQLICSTKRASAGVGHPSFFPALTWFRVINVAGGSPGALRGTNAVFWDNPRQWRHRGQQRSLFHQCPRPHPKAIPTGAQKLPRIAPIITFLRLAASPSTSTPTAPIMAASWWATFTGPPGGRHSARGDNDGIIKWNADGSFRR